MDFNIISASDVSASYRQFVELNYPGRVMHFFGSIEDQISKAQKCLSCQGSLSADLFGCHPSSDLRAGSDVDLMVSGSPCDPFSTQRAKRWHCGGVKAHTQFDITMKSVVKLYQQYEPVKGIFEQVHGFTLPFEKGGEETPKKRQAFFNHCALVSGVVFCFAPSFPCPSF